MSASEERSQGSMEQEQLMSKHPPLPHEVLPHPQQQPRQKPVQQPAESRCSIREVLGEAQFAEVRATMLRQQRVFVGQLFELHKLCQVQKLLCSEVFGCESSMPAAAGVVNELFLAADAASKLSQPSVSAPARSKPQKPANAATAASQGQDCNGAPAVAAPGVATASAPPHHCHTPTPGPSTAPPDNPKTPSTSNLGSSGERSLQEKFQQDIQLLVNIPKALRKQVKSKPEQQHNSAGVPPPTAIAHAFKPQPSRPRTLDSTDQGPEQSVSVLQPAGPYAAAAAHLQALFHTSFLPQQVRPRLSMESLVTEESKERHWMHFLLQMEHAC